MNEKVKKDLAFLKKWAEKYMDGSISKYILDDLKGASVHYSKGGGKEFEADSILDTDFNPYYGGVVGWMGKNSGTVSILFTIEKHKIVKWEFDNFAKNAVNKKGNTLKDLVIYLSTKNNDFDY